MGPVYCPACGAPFASDTRFCGGCGAAMPEPAPVRSWILGSSPGCTIVIPEPTVSGRHCRLWRAGDTGAGEASPGEGFLIEDLGSANGTWVEGRRIFAVSRVEYGQAITLGRSVPFDWDQVAPPMAPAVRIGRHPDNDVVLDYPAVSGYHARLVATAEGVFIEDLGSTNGTALNVAGAKIRRARIVAADVVYFGSQAVPASRLLPALGAAPAATLPEPELAASPEIAVSDPGMEPADWKPEIASVLFTDIIGFTRLDPGRQVRARRKLEQCVQDSEAFRKAKQANTLVARSTGDGMALVFFAHPTVAAECAVQISKLLVRTKSLALRMGIHHGTLYRLKDINGSDDVSGSGINTAQRVMDCGDAGSILLSAAAAEALRGTIEWHDRVQPMGMRKIKHGDSIEIYSLQGPDFGRLEQPAPAR